MSKKHRVKSHHWENGILTTFEHFFHEVEQALEFAANLDHHHVKVYDAEGGLVSSKQNSANPNEINTRSTYA